MFKLNTFLIGVILSMGVTFLQAESYGSSNNTCLLKMLSEDSGDCVNIYEGDKIYINSNKIVLTNEGDFIKIQKKLCPLPLLQSDAKGHYIQARFIMRDEMSPSARTKGPCPVCDRPTDKNGFCINPECVMCELKVR